VQYAAAGLLFALGAAVFETGVVNWTPQFLFALGWLVLVLSLGAVWLLYFLIRRAAATRVVSLFYLTPPVTALYGLGAVQRTARAAGASRHGRLRPWRVLGQLEVERNLITASRRRSHRHQFQ
jgi:drug/metabolite transporter (DMT)-like permease